MKTDTFPFILTNTFILVDKIYTDPFASVAHGMSNDNLIFTSLELASTGKGICI
jgi:hypothetical protein